MNIKEKNDLINEFQYQVKNHLALPDSEGYKITYYAQKRIMELFFSKKEIVGFENEIRITSNYYADFFESVQSWINEAHKDWDVMDEFYFKWDEDGLRTVDNAYNWLFSMEKYKGFKLALELAQEKLEEYNKKYNMYI